MRNVITKIHRQFRQTSAKLAKLSHCNVLLEMLQMKMRTVGCLVDQGKVQKGNERCDAFFKLVLSPAIVLSNGLQALMVIHYMLLFQKK